MVYTCVAHSQIRLTTSWTNLAQLSIVWSSETASHHYKQISLSHNCCKENLQCLAYLCLNYQSSQTTKLYQHSPRSWSSFSSAVIHICKISFSDVCYLLLWEIFKQHTALKSTTKNESPHTSPKNTPTNLSFFNPVTEEEVAKIILNSSNSLCDLDPVLTSRSASV